MREFINPGEAALRPQPHEDYGRLSIDLSTARTNEEIQIHGDYLAKIKYDGTATGCYFTIDHRHAAKIYAKEFKSLQRRYARLFLTNTAQAGKVLVMQINETDVSVIIPELDTGKLSEIEVAVEAIQALQEIDGAGDLQKIKEELETINAQMLTDNAVLDALLLDTADIETAIEILDDIVQIEDSAHVSTQKGVMPLAVRKNVATAMGEDGDYHPVEVSSTGEVWVNDTDGNVLLGTIDSDTDAIKTAVQVMDDWDDADHAKVVPPLMESDVLSVSTDAGTDETAAPGAGFAWEVLGYQVSEHVQANATINLAAHLEIETSLMPLWGGCLNAKAVAESWQTTISGIRIRGAENKKIILTGADVNAAAGKVQAIIFMRKVAV